MRTRQTVPDHVEQPGRAPARAGVKRALGGLERWREPAAEQKRARLVSARNRRILARWLLRTAKKAVDRNPICRRREPLLHYRAAAVRTDLLEIAALLEHAHNADPACLEALRTLLANGIDSPLYNTTTPFSELEATLNYVRSGL